MRVGDVLRTEVGGRGEAVAICVGIMSRKEKPDIIFTAAIDLSTFPRIPKPNKKAKGKHNLGDSNLSEEMKESGEHIKGKQQDNFVGTTKNDHVYHSELESSNLPALGKRDWKTLAMATKDVPVEVEVIETKSNNLGNKRRNNGNRTRQDNGGNKTKREAMGKNTLVDSNLPEETKESSGLMKGKQPNSFVGTTKNGHVDHSKLEFSNFPDLGPIDLDPVPSYMDVLPDSTNTTDQDALGDEVYMCDQYVVNTDSETAENTSDSVWADNSGYSSCSGPSKRGGQRSTKGPPPNVSALHVGEC
uniref:Uncharacterized protein n=1 Tax=Oryza glumipatula TaxID=40148 RepID=A0A0E0B0N0_9ORYZ